MSANAASPSGIQVAMISGMQPNARGASWALSLPALVGGVCLAFAQSPEKTATPKFEVASIKRDPACDSRRNRDERPILSPDRAQWNCMALDRLMKGAMAVPDFDQIARKSTCSVPTRSVLTLLSAQRTRADNN
jgi:hypothetical protein